MTKEQFKQNEHLARLTTHKMINKGFAVSMQTAILMGILHSIHKEIDPLIEAKHKAELWLAGTGRNENQNYVADLEKYSTHVYSIGKQTEPDLAIENEPRFAMILESAKLAETWMVSE